MNDDIATLLELSFILHRLGLSYVVIGGVAARAYGIPRPTYDIDFTVAIPRERLPEFFQAVEEKGYTVPDSYRFGWVDSVSDMSLIKVRCYLRGQGVDVDIFLAENDFQMEILKRRRLSETPDGRIWLATPEDIILLKLIANRTRDLLDINDILFTQGELDRPYLQKWADWLGIRDRLDKAWTQLDEMI